MLIQLNLNCDVSNSGDVFSIRIAGNIINEDFFRQYGIGLQSSRVQDNNMAQYEVLATTSKWAI